MLAKEGVRVGVRFPASRIYCDVWIWTPRSLVGPLRFVENSTYSVKTVPTKRRVPPLRLYGVTTWKVAVID